MSFKDEFLKTSPGPMREALVFNAAIKQGPPKQLVPITVNAPDGSKITYRTMPDYLMIDGIRVPMAGATAQKLADYWKMKLPTTKMSRQIWDAADAKIRPTPLSAGGRIGGKYYSGKDVVKSKISDSDSSIAYNEMINRQLAELPDRPNLVAGHMKDIVQPLDPNKLGLYGWYDEKGRPIQYSAQTPHDITVHTEYGAGTRFVDDIVTITRPDGKIETKTMDEIQRDPDLSKAVALETGTKRYNVGVKTKDSETTKPKKTTPVVPVVHNYEPNKPKSGRLALLQRIDNFLNQFD